jgi:FkbM family methyltransferase
MHRGEDAGFYLSKGFRVVGIEANPALVREVEARFAAEIRDGRLHVVGKAIAAREGRVRFAVNRQLSVWGTTSEEFAERNARTFGAESDVIEVEATTFDAVLRAYGMPYYLKLDIEGCETLCLEALRRFPERPAYVSVESRAASPRFGFRDTLEEIALLRALGYGRFQYVAQAAIPGTTRALGGEGEPVEYVFPPDSSGPFGGDLAGRWLTARQASLVGLFLRGLDDLCGHSGRFYGRWWARPFRRLRRVLTGRGDQWYDLHARLAA